MKNKKLKISREELICALAEAFSLFGACESIRKNDITRGLLMSVQGARISKLVELYLFDNKDFEEVKEKLLKAAAKESKEESKEETEDEYEDDSFTGVDKDEL